MKKIILVLSLIFTVAIILTVNNQTKANLGEEYCNTFDPKKSDPCDSGPPVNCECEGPIIKKIQQ